MSQSMQISQIADGVSCVAGSAPALITFATGVESGPMETLVIRLVDSLRRWGGIFADAPFIAVKPRRSAPIARATLQAFDRLGVQYREAKPSHGMSWYVWLNKAVTLAEAEHLTSSEHIAWLDADMLILGEPNLMLLGKNEDFAACAADKNIGSSGPGDAFEPYWIEMCRLAGIDIEQLPWITTERERARIRLYFNAGLFVYRRSTGFAAPFMANVTRLLQAKVRSKTDGVFPTEQMTLGLTMHKLGLRWRALPHAYNYAIGSKLRAAGLYDAARFAEVKVLHYHDAMWPHMWQQFLTDLRVSRGDVADWLESQGPLTDSMPLPRKLYNRAIAAWRKRQYKAHEQACRAL